MRKTEMELVHHGASAFDLTLFEPISDGERGFKPGGGLWCSPVGSEWGWSDWCLSENHNWAVLDVCFKLRFVGRLLVIDGPADLEKLSWSSILKLPSECLPRRLQKQMRDLSFLQRPEFEPLLAQGYDAVHLTVDGERETRFSLPYNLYGWDCETVLILNPESVRPLA